MSFDTFGKELRLISVSLSGFRVESQSRIIALAFGLRKFLILRQDSVRLVSKRMSLQNFSQLACDSILRLSLISFCNWLIPVFSKGPCAWEYCRLSLRFSLISASDSSETGWLSGRPLLDVGMALSSAVLIAVTIKSAYLSLIYILSRLKLENISWAQCRLEGWFKHFSVSPIKFTANGVTWLVCMFLSGWASIEISMGR